MSKTASGWTSLIAIVLALFALILVVGGWGTRNLVLQQGNQDVLSVSGQSEITVNPDRADVLVRIETRDRDAQAAQAENRKRSERVRQALVDAGIEAESIETTQHLLERVEEYNRRTGDREFKVYKQSHVMKLTTTELEKVGKYIDAAVEAGANGIDHVSFDLTKEERKKVRNEALKRASEQARAKAETLAESLGVNLGNPVRINESQFNLQPYRASQQTASFKAQSDDLPGTQVSPEQVKVTVGVSIEFKIH